MSTISELTIAQRDMQISAHEILDSCFDAIRAQNGQINAFVDVFEDSAYRRARELDDQSARGVSAGPLHGVPIGVKDMIDVAGHVTTMGSRAFVGNVAEADAHCIAHLRDAGAIILGKLNLDEMALGATGSNTLFGPCRHPTDPGLIPGGSSSGSAAAVRSGMCIAALGTDTAGSVRVPASLCGVVGFKPSQDLVDLRGVASLSWTLDCVGPISVNLEDISVLLGAMSRTKRDCQNSMVYSGLSKVFGSAERRTRGIRRVGLLAERFEAQAEVASQFQVAVNTMASLGMTVEPVQAELTSPGGIISTEAAANYESEFTDRPQDFGEDVQMLLRAALARSPLDYVRARQSQLRIIEHFRRLFERYDLLLTATTPVSSVHVEEIVDARSVATTLTSNTAAVNVAGLPAVALPLKAAGGEHPASVQLIGRHSEDFTLLEVAGRLAATMGT